MSANDDYKYLQSLGMPDYVLKDLAEEGNDDFVVIEKPFAQVLTSDDKSFTVPMEFAGNQIELTLRKDLTDNNWWIEENGTVNGESYTSISRFTLNSFIHFHKNFTYIFVSPYPIDNMDMSVAFSSLLVKY